MKSIQKKSQPSNIWVVLIALSFAALISCAPVKSEVHLDSPSDADAVSILGGQNANLDFQSKNGVVGLLIVSEEANGDKAQSICTGSLIAKRLILTAAHCIADPTIAIVIAVFDVDLKKALKEKTYVPAGKISVHEAYLPKNDGGVFTGKNPWNDIGLIELKADAPATFAIAQLPTALELKLLSKGSQLTLAGFGISTPVVNEMKVVEGKEQIVAVEEKTATSGVLRAVSGITVLDAPLNNKEILIDQLGGKKGACHGDSGGPAYLSRADGTLALIGVTSRGTNQLGNCNEKAIYTNIYGSLGWIKNQAKIWGTAL